MTERVRLYEDNEERDRYDRLADLFSIVVAIEKVETAYNRSNMSAKDYEEQCSMLLRKYKNIYSVVAKSIGSLEQFLQEYRSSYPTAVARIKAGVPLTADDHGPATGQSILEAGQHMINCVDALKMGQISADALQPIFADIVSTVSRIYPNLAELNPIKEWLRLVSGMRAADELTEEQVRQCQHDVEKAYGAFSQKLGSR